MTSEEIRIARLTIDEQVKALMNLYTVPYLLEKVFNHGVWDSIARIFAMINEVLGDNKPPKRRR
jgi:hypothetical protein